jgi:hypothetical protein
VFVQSRGLKPVVVYLGSILEYIFVDIASICILEYIAVDIASICGKFSDILYCSWILFLTLVLTCLDYIPLRPIASKQRNPNIFFCKQQYKCIS